MSNDLEEFLVGATIEELREYIRTTEAILEQRNRVMNTIPECEVHGHSCVPHAVEWILTHLTESDKL